MLAIKGGILVDAQTDQLSGELTYYNVTQFTHNRQEEHPIWRETEAYVLRQAQPHTEKYSRQRMSDSPVGMLGSIVLVRSQESSERLLMYEFTMPFLRRESISLASALTSENARVPMLLVFFGITAFYQLYWKEGAPFNPNTKKQKDADAAGKGQGSAGMMSGFRDHAKKHGKLTP